jgi:hypothetical protein
VLASAGTAGKRRKTSVARTISRLASLSDFLFEHSTTVLALVTWLTGSVVAKYTQFLKPYAPYSFVLAGLVAAVLVLAMIGLGNFSFQQAAKRRFWDHVKEPARTVNPLAATFDGERIFIADVADPSQRWIQGKTFTNCEIVGRRISLVFFGCTFHNPVQFYYCDLISAAVIAGQAAPPIATALTVRDCVFINCRFYSATLVFPHFNARQFIAAGIAAAQQWLVPPPPQ